jgi:hypothetical protein
LDGAGAAAKVVVLLRDDCFKERRVERLQLFLRFLCFPTSVDCEGFLKAASRNLGFCEAVFPKKILSCPAEFGEQGARREVQSLGVGEAGDFQGE